MVSKRKKRKRKNKKELLKGVSSPNHPTSFISPISPPLSSASFLFRMLSFVVSHILYPRLPSGAPIKENFSPQLPLPKLIALQFFWRAEEKLPQNSFLNPPKK